MTDEPASVIVVGGGVAGLSAAIFTARAGVSTRIVSAGV
nr:FAD-binding protein [Halomicroarcula sp. XH51]